MFFRKMRKQTKTIVIIVCVAILAGLLYTGGVALFGGGPAGPWPLAKVNGKTITYHELQRLSFSFRFAQQREAFPRDYEVARYRALMPHRP